jgi:hypothetical protein
MKRIPAILICILLVALLTSIAFAMSSAAYRIDWNNLLSGSGGSANSPDYQINFTIGQTVRGDATSPQYHAQLGYWVSSPLFLHIYIPRVERNP